MLFEFFLHIRDCYQIIRLHRSIESVENILQIQTEMKNKLQKLVLDETLDVLILLVYSLGSAFVIYDPLINLSFKHHLDTCSLRNFCNWILR